MTEPEQPAPSLRGRLVLPTELECPECKRRGWRTARGTTPRMVTLASAQRLPWEPDLPFCISHGYPNTKEL